MLEQKGKDTVSFQNIYGDSLIVNMSKSSGCLQVWIKNKSNVFFQKSTVFIGSICAIVLLGSSLALNTSLIVIGISLMLYILYKLLFVIIEEKLFIIKGLGCYLCKRHWYGERTMFIPYEDIQEIFINEVIFRRRVIYLLTLFTKAWTKEEYEHKLVPLFLNLLPKNDCLQIIYKNIKYLENR